MRDHIEEMEDAEECSILLGERFNMEPQALMNDSLALVEATARWHIRGDGDPEALTWLRELVSWQRCSAEKIARAATVILERELLPPVEALAVGWEVSTYRS